MPLRFPGIHARHQILYQHIIIQIIIIIIADTGTELIGFLKENGVMAVSHYVPLHSAPAGRKFGRFHGEDKYTTKNIPYTGAFGKTR